MGALQVLFVDVVYCDLHIAPDNVTKGNFFFFFFFFYDCTKIYIVGTHWNQHKGN